jgi:hypothetical protein
MAAAITGNSLAATGALTEVSSVARNAVGLVVAGVDDFGNFAEYIYLKGVASTIAGSVVTYDHAGATLLLIVNQSGPVAVALAATVASTYGWYAITGTHLVDVVANSAACVAGGKNPGRETTDGKVGDGRAAGDEIANFFQRVATTTAALAYCQISRPYVNDFLGA